MAFIFGIIDFSDTSLLTNEINLLGKSVSWEGFNQHVFIQNEWLQLGKSWHPKRAFTDTYLETDTHIVLYEGRIFNTDKLHKEIIFEKDAACFLNAFLKWGEYAADRINGEFAVVIINKKTKQVDFFRDHIGVVSLSYAYINNQFIFASHPFGIALSSLFPITYNERYLLMQEMHVKTDYCSTYFKEIDRVIHGLHYTIQHPNVSKCKYWQPETHIRNSTLTKEEVVSNLRILLKKAVLNRMVDGVIGAHVSGGLDCTGVASIVAENLPHGSILKGYSWTPQNLNSADTKIATGGNEKEFIDAFSQEKKVSIKYVEAPYQVFTESNLIPEFEQMPIERPVMLEAEKDNVAIMFSGWGGDEFLSLSNRGLFDHYFHTGQWLILLKHLFGKTYKVTIRFLVKQFLDFFTLHSKRKFDQEIANQFSIYDPDFLKRNLPFLKENLTSESIFGKKGRHQFIINLLYNYHLTKRIDSWSHYGEKYGISYTYPLLDKDLLDYWFSIPIKYTFDEKKTRGLYREVVKGFLIDSIRLRRDKTENLRLQHTYYQRLDSLPSLLKQVEEIDPNTFPFIEKEIVEQKTKLPANPTPMDVFTKSSLLILYLKESKLYEKYFSK